MCKITKQANWHIIQFSSRHTNIILKKHYALVPALKTKKKYRVEFKNSQSLWNLILINLPGNCASNSEFKLQLMQPQLQLDKNPINYYYNFLF